MPVTRRVKRVLITAVLTLCASGTAVPHATALEPAPPAAPTTLVAVGDIACAPGFTVTPTSCQHGAVADLVSRLAPASLLTLGDHQYRDGTLAEFQGSYDASWGRFRSINRPVVGNHEYQTLGAAGYYDYFGAAAGDRTQGWYSYDVGGWHVVVLNSECSKVGGCGVGSPQEQWLRADLAANPRSCTIASWHRPRWSSSTAHPSYSSTSGLYAALYDAGVELLLGGHVHAYERFAPLDPWGRIDVSRGIRQFAVGTGGVNLHKYTLPPLPGTETRWDAGFGALRLSLGSAGYDWRLVGTDDAVIDAGSAPCHGAGVPTDVTAPSAPSALTGAASSAGSVALTWTPGRDDTGLVVHRIRRDGVLIGTTGDVGTWTDPGAPVGASATYGITAVDAAGNESAAATVRVAVPGAPGTFALDATDDTWIEAAAPTATHGSDLRVNADGDPDQDVLLRFPQAPCTPSAATLRMTTGGSAGDGGPRGGDVAVTSPAWSGASVSWGSAPLAGEVLGSLPPPEPDAVVRADVTAGVTASAPIAFRISNPTVDGVRYVSSEGASGQRPQLVVQCAVPDLSPPTPPTAVSAIETAPGSVALSWSPGTDDVGVAGYVIRRDGTVVADVPGTSWTDTGLAGGRAYTWTVASRDGAGNPSAQSAPVSVTTAVVREVVLAPTDDTYVDGTYTTSSYGSASRLAVDDAPRQDVLLRFVVPSTCAVSRATLRLTVGTSGGDNSNHGAAVHSTSASWTAATATWANAPATGTSLGVLPPAALGAAVSADVTAGVTSGPVAFRLPPRGSDGMRFFSSEGSATSGPRLVAECAAAATGDTTAPTAPTGVTAVEGTAGTVSVSWLAASDEVGVTGYRVLRDGAQVAIVGAVTSWSDSGRAPATTYSYAVQARDAAGNWSLSSPTASVTTAAPPPPAPPPPPLADTTAPTVPSGVTATETSPGTVSLSWTPSTDAVGVTGYVVRRGGTTIGSPTATSFTDTGLSPATAYSYTVAAVDAATNASAESAATQVTTAPVAPAPARVLTFVATDDAYVAQSKQNSRYGTRSVLTADASPKLDVLLRFAPDLTGCVVKTTALVLTAGEGSVAAGIVQLTSPQWSQSTVTWASAPAAFGDALASIGRVVTGQVYETQLTWTATSGPVAFRLSSSSSDGVDWKSTEAGGTSRPTLKVTCA